MGRCPCYFYTEQSQRVLALAKEEALSLKHYYVGTEHLLLGILVEGSIAAPLIEQGTTREHVRAGLLLLIASSLWSDVMMIFFHIFIEKKSAVASCW